MTTNKPTLYIPGSFIQVCAERHAHHLREESIKYWKKTQGDYDFFTLADLQSLSHEGCPWRCERENARDYFIHVHKLDVSEDVVHVAEYMGHIPEMSESCEIDRYHLAAATVHRMDYFLTWDKWPAQLLRNLRVWSQECNFMVPELVTPEILCHPERIFNT